MTSAQPDRIVPVAQATKLWSRFGFSAPSELVPEDIAWTLGILVLEGRLDTADARLVRGGKKGLIRLKSDIPEPGRKRFAVAHEIGHWLLHESISQIMSCTGEDLIAAYKTSSAELEANLFAAELLMPQRLFLKRITNQERTVAFIKDLAADFLTTLTATLVRYVEVTDEQVALVVSENGRIRWWRQSEAYKEHIWISAGEQLSEDTRASAYFSDGELLGDEAEEVPAAAWLGDRAGEDETLQEIGIALPRYEQVLSLIWPS